MKPKNGILKLDTKEINLPNEVITEVFYEMLDQMEIDLKKANRKMIFETHEISIENAKKQFEPLGFDIYCMGMPNENVDNLMKQIRKNDYWIGHFKRNRRIKKITKEVLHELVENIFVYENGQVEVTFKYKDEFMNLIKYLEEKGVINDEKMEDWSVSKAII